MSQKRAVIITGPGYEDSEVIYPYYRLLEEGLQVDIATSTDKGIKGKHGYPLEPTITINNLSEENFDIVIIPGGHEAPDRVRQLKKVLDFIRAIHKKEKLIASVCHGPWVLISAGIMKGTKATCYIGMKDDLINAGSIYQTSSVVLDKNIVTSDHPRNMGFWMKKVIELLSQS